MCVCVCVCVYCSSTKSALVRGFLVDRESHCVSSSQRMVLVRTRPPSPQSSRFCITSVNLPDAPEAAVPQPNLSRKAFRDRAAGAGLVAAVEEEAADPRERA